MDIDKSDQCITSIKGIVFILLIEDVFAWIIWWRKYLTKKCKLHNNFYIIFYFVPIESHLVCEKCEIFI